VVFIETGIDADMKTPLRQLVTDSLEMVSLLQEIEAMTGIDIPDEVATQFLTVSDLVGYIDKNSNA